MSLSLGSPLPGEWPYRRGATAILAVPVARLRRVKLCDIVSDTGESQSCALRHLVDPIRKASQPRLPIMLK
jgi:hypothetical protein